jgi:tetratricopeptide (TPR) repeat protein
MTPQPGDDLNTALSLHQTGRLQEAVQIYQRLLDKESLNPDALHLLGVATHQMGDHARAVELIGRAIAVRPSVAVFHANLAEAYRAFGQLDRAIGCCRTALRLQPNLAEAANNLGLIYLQQNKIEEARAQFENAVRFQPAFALAYNNLGNAYRLGGDEERAIASFRQALQHNRDLGEAHSNLGQLLLERNDLEPALLHCREAVRLQPNTAEAHNNLGNVLRRKGQFVEARACYAEALRLNPELALTYGNMGQVLQEDGNLEEAVTWYRQALELDPNSARLHCFLGSAFEEQEEYNGAAEEYQKALRLDPEFADAYNGLGWVRHQQGDYTDARRQYEEALRRRGNFPIAQCNLASLITELGDFTGAERLYREVIRHNPTSVVAYSQLATLQAKKLPQEDETALRQLLANPNNTDQGRMHLHYSLAQVCDARGNYEEAADHLRRANALKADWQKKADQSYDPDKHRGFVNALIGHFTPELFARFRGRGLETELPVFIVGLPRSGTTLTEQVLAQHSKVFGAGELYLAREDFLNLPEPPSTEARALEGLRNLEVDNLHRVARHHLEKLRALHASAERIVDKMPDNYMYLGLLSLLFPNAKFIYCRRDLRDVAVSCWMTHFRHIRWANDLDHIRSRFEEHLRIMDHWRRVLPVPVLEVDYEELVADLEGMARRMLAWCGLDWEPACLAFHEVQRPVRTASVLQVRQPLYSRSVARWKRYEPFLGSFFDRLISTRTPPER